MKTSILLLIIVTTGFSCCGQASKSKTDPVESETINSVRNYVYADSMGNRLLIHNSGPKGVVKYTDANGAEFRYVVFWTQFTNETKNPVDLKIDFPLDSFEFPSSSGRYMKLLLPSDTMTSDKASLTDFGLNVKSFLDTHHSKPSSLNRTINPNESTAFYVVILSPWNSAGGGGGALRTGLVLKGQNLLYKLSIYKTTPELPLIDKKEITCGSINLKNLTLRK